MKFKLVLLALVSLALLATGTASAYISPEPPSTSTQPLTRCFTTGAISLSQGQYLRFGWGTVSKQQALDFLEAQNFTLTLSGSGGTTLGWATGNTDLWTAPALVPGQNTVNGNKPFWQTVAYLQINVPVGTYTLSTAGTSVSRAVFDGADVTKKGQNWFQIPTTCTLTVT